MKKITKTMHKLLSVFLVILIVMQILPLQVLAESITDAIEHKEFIEDVLNNPTLENNTSDAEILYEVEEKRDEYTKVYKKSDGTYTAVKTLEPLHYLNDGVWEEINNSMTLDGNLYTNLDNLFNVEFPESIDSNENLTVEKDGYELSFSVDEIEESSAVVENDIVVSDTNISVADEAISQTQSSVTYNDVAENTDLQYIVTPNSIKENIIVSDKESVKDTYTFTFETNGLNTEKLDDGSVVFKDENDEVKFRIPRPVMTDSSLAYSYDINVVLIENTDDTITLEYSPSTEWINSSERVYPITIDPAITVEKYDPWVEDTYVACETINGTNSNFDKTNYSNANIVDLATNLTRTDEDGKTKKFNSEVYTKLNMDFFRNIGSNVIFTEVQYLFGGNLKTSGNFFAKEITQEWNINEVTYDNRPNLSVEVIDYYTSTIGEENDSINGVFIHFNITNIFNEWFNGKDNNGFAIIADETAMATLYLNSSFTNTAMVIDYVEMGGYNENFNYHSQAVGRAGTGYVNDFTQSLSVIRDDLSIDGNIMPVTVGMIYNSASYDKLELLGYQDMMAYGNNWIPNYFRAFMSNNENSITYYTNTGSTIDFFRSIDDENNITYTELFTDIYGSHGYELKYYLDTNAKPEYIVIRPDGLEERFNEWGLLTSVTNSDYPSQNINITYDEMYRIDRITDGVGRKYDYIYDDNDKLLSKIKCYGANEVEIKVGLTQAPLEVNYDYDVNKNLTSVTFPDGKSIKYTYDTQGNIKTIENIDGYLIAYGYDEKGKITNITEQALDNDDYVDGNSFSYVRLSPTQIRFTDKNGNYETYQFNNNGTLLYTTDSNGNYAINNAQGFNNNSFYVLDNEYHTISQNLLLNASFEDKPISASHAEHWEKSDSYFERTTDEEYWGEYVYKASTEKNTTAYLRQTVEVLSGGKYTFSAYIKSEETNGGKVYLNISSIDSSNTKITETRAVESTVGDWQRYFVTIDAPSNTKKIVVEFGFKESKGTFYIDNVQLEQSSSATEYNLIENGGFRKDIECWETDSTYSIENTNIIDSNEKAISFGGNTDGTNVVYQLVKINGEKNDVFTIGGWFKGSIVNSTTNNPFIQNIISDTQNNDNLFNFTNDRFAQIDVYGCDEFEEVTAEEDLIKLVTIPFCDNTDDWQFAANNFKIYDGCNELLVVITSSNIANSVSFSNIELTKNNNAITEIDNETNSEEDIGCQCPTCEKPSCPCVCENETKCKCVTCMQKNTTIMDDFGNITSVNSFDGIKTLQTLTRYTGDGNYVFAHTFADGTVLTYEYNQLNGLLDAIIDGKEVKTSYTYDASTALTGILTEDSLAEYEYTNDKLTAITHNNFSYNLKYDCWGQLIEIAVEEQPIISYEYGEGQFRERIIRTKYYNSASNPTITDYIYDAEGNIIEVLVNDKTEFTIKYNSLGSITEIEKVGCRRVCYTDFGTKVYDLDGNVIYSIDIKKDGTTIETIGGDTYTTKLQGGFFDKNTGNSTDMKDISVANGKTIGSKVEGDCFGRYQTTVVQTKSVNDKKVETVANDEDDEKQYAAVTSKYFYPEFNDKTTNSQVTSYANIVTYGKDTSSENTKSNYVYNYKYDANGNIIEITQSYSNNTNSYVYYEYDELNQLKTEIDFSKRLKYVYVYDNAGNIDYKEIYMLYIDEGVIKEQKDKTIDYSYDDIWKDKLISYNGNGISYDDIGNPVLLNGATLTWSGTQLESYTIDDTDGNNNITKQIRYSYNEQGLLHCKAVWIKPFGSSDASYQRSEQYDYTWTNGQLSNLVYTKTQGDNSTTSYTVKFIYDIMNTPYGFILKGSDNIENVYLFIKNLQGDIVGIVDEQGKTVLTYAYNSWGQPSEPVAVGDEIIEQLKNVLPMTYRCYCYDYDSGLYYIQNRYYNPEIGRFINADSINSLITAKTVLDFNLFSYCGNNPVTHSLIYKNTSEYLTIESNYLYNKSKSNEIKSYIYKQDDSHDDIDGVVSPLHFGNTKFGPNGCGLVATYNALIMLGNRTDIADINREYEINGVSVCGTIAFYPAFIVRYFKSKGYEVSVTYNVKCFDCCRAKKADANILYYTHENAGHYIALKYVGDHYIAYNNLKDINEGDSVKSLLNGNKGQVLISISKGK